ncbi:MAG TPA: hypothetical protein VKQ36_14635 [Ktedonobacterales bacterium]|nr:hypothetical protein [Ktedonobacterales bacterium]
MEWEPQQPTYSSRDPHAGSQWDHGSPPGAPSRQQRGQRGAWLARVYASNPLDAWVFTFQHRWETSAQFRRTASVVIATTALVLLCAFVTLATTITTSALANARANTGGPNAGGPNTGTNAFNVPTSFPTSTVPAWPTPVYPNGNPIPNSQTPQPSPTVTASPTASHGGGGGSCSGGHHGVEWSFDPCPQVAGQGGTLTISAPSYAGKEVNILLSFNCSNPSDSGCTIDEPPSSSTTLDASGDLTLSYTVPASATSITGSIQPDGGSPVFINGPSVQS